MLLAAFVWCTVCVCPAKELVRNGRYSRWIPVEIGVERGWIYRKRCSACTTSFSLLPGIVLPGMRYPRSLVLTWLWARLWGCSVRNRRFLTMHALECPAPAGDTSWTDLLDCEGSRSRPGYSVLWCWSRSFAARSLRRLPLLVTAFVALGLHMGRDLAVPLERMRAVPPPSYWLANALGLWRALMEATRTDGRAVGLEEALSSLADFLMVEPSHGFTRALLPCSDYAESGLAGRSPPTPAVTEEA
jgi:hypothetical protein